MDPGKFQLLTEADFVLSACGRFSPPVGSVVYVPKGFLIQAVLPVTSNQTFYKEITGDTTWCWRSISLVLSASVPLISAQVLKPDGQFLFNGLLDLTQVAGFGSYRYLLSREIECPPGSKIQLNLDDNYLDPSVVQPISMLCGGAYAYYLKDGRPSQCTEDDISDLPRIFATPNQNLLAPCWMAGLGPQCPEGWTAEAFTYGDGNANVASVTLGDNAAKRIAIQIDADSDFHCRRLMFDIRGDSATTPTGRWLMRIRAGSGYAFTDDYVDAANYFNGAYSAKGWDIKRGDTVQIDLVLVDQIGTGTITLEVFLDGEKRRRVA